MEILIWFIVLMVSLAALLQGAGWFSAGMAKIFCRGKNNEAAVIAAALPELALALAATAAGRPELVLPVVLGSSLANILLAAGTSATAAGGLPVKKDAIDADAPLLAAAAALFCFVAYDGRIVFFEGLLLLAAFFGYGFFIFSRRGENNFTPRDLVFSAASRRGIAESVASRFSRGFNQEVKGISGALMLAAIGAMLLALAANYTVESLANVAVILAIPAAVLAMSVLSAAGVLPEISSSLEIIFKKRCEVALGNLFSSTVVNLLLVAGAAAMFSTLPLGGAAMSFGLPFLAAAAGLLTISGLCRKINAGQGWLFLVLYFLFLSKIFNLF